MSDQVVPVLQTDLHTTSAVAVQGDVTPMVHVPVVVHVWQGSLPLLLKVDPPTQGIQHLVSELAEQAVSTPTDPHDESALHVAHGSMPVAALNVTPPTQAALHTVSVVALHATLTP